MLGASSGMPYIGPVAMFVFIALHLMITKFKTNEILFIISTGMIGMFVDSAFHISGIIFYKSSISNTIAPLWIIAMWLGFAATVNHSMSWLDKKYIYGLALGLVFGPLSYVTGEKFGAITFAENRFTSLTILAFAWGIVVPSLYYLNDRYYRKGH